MAIRVSALLTRTGDPGVTTVVWRPRLMAVSQSESEHTKQPCVAAETRPSVGSYKRQGMQPTAYAADGGNPVGRPSQTETARKG